MSEDNYVRIREEGKNEGRSGKRKGEVRKRIGRGNNRKEEREQG